MGYLGATEGSDPSLIVANAAVITGKVLALTFHDLLTLISRSLYLLSFSVSFILMFESSAVAISISRQVFSFFYHAVLYQVSLRVLFHL
jgi:hypothetical protein